MVCFTYVVKISTGLPIVVNCLGLSLIFIGGLNLPVIFAVLHVEIPSPIVWLGLLRSLLPLCKPLSDLGGLIVPFCKC